MQARQGHRKQAFLTGRCPAMLLVREVGLVTLPSGLASYQSISAAAAAKSLQSSPTLCDTIDGSPLGSPVPGILQAGTLEWVAISFSSA